jgi:transcription elongation GreA/GreB family factor
MSDDLRMSLPDKASVVAAVVATVEAELAGVEAMAEMARDEATSEETKAEGKYDTRATEASYLARGQAWRIAELAKLRAWLDTSVAARPCDIVQVGALLQIDGARQELLYVAPVGGSKAELDGHTIRVISLQSPLGAAMAELEAEDAFEVQSPRGTLVYEISAIA